MNKVVASRTLPVSSDPKVRVIKVDVVAELAALKRRPGGDIMIFASPTLVHSLLPHDVSDDWRLTIQPVTLGGGLPCSSLFCAVRSSSCVRRRRSLPA